MTACIIDHFSTLKDHRIERNKLHSLLDIIVLSICAVSSGADGWEAIKEFGQEKEDWLHRYISLENGIPSHDCIAYTLRGVSPSGFRECFMNWVNAAKEQTDGEIIAIDGKTARGSRDRKACRHPLHMVSAWACSNRLVLAQEATSEKSNEITAIPKLLELLELKGCIVTLDAMGCQKAITTQIIEQEADYVIGLKGNQGTLHGDVTDFFNTARAADFKAVNYDFIEETGSGHGRIETRRYWITEELSSLSTVSDWTGLRSIGMVERECWQDDKKTVETRFFIASISQDAKRFALAVRGHWGVRILCIGDWMWSLGMTPARFAETMDRPS